MKNLFAPAVGVAALLATGVASAQSDMMNGGYWGGGWMGSYGGVWLPVLLVVVVVGLVAWIVMKKRK